MTTRPSENAHYRRRSVTSALPSEDLAALDLRQLREYRSGLGAEEDKVSYWRRLAQARMDVLQAQANTHSTLSFDDLVKVLGDTGTGVTRQALVQFKVADPLPDLPALAEMWVTDVDPLDDVQVAKAVERLEAAEHKLSAYRVALHERIDEATRELILRYRAHPSSALAAIPQG